MIRHKTFASKYQKNYMESATLKELESLRQQAERYIAEKLLDEAVITIAETNEEYASTVTIWYRCE
jgi:hypothetical protein